MRNSLNCRAGTYESMATRLKTVWRLSMHRTDGSNSTQRDNVSALASRKRFPPDVLWKTRPRCRGGRHEFAAISRRRTKVRVRIPADGPASRFFYLSSTYAFSFISSFFHFLRWDHEQDKNIQDLCNLYIRWTQGSFLSDINLSQGRNFDLQCKYWRLFFLNAVKRWHNNMYTDKYNWMCQFIQEFSMKLSIM